MIAMIKDEELKKIQWNAQRAINDMGKGATITLAMDPAMMFAIASELLKLRSLQKVAEEIYYLKVRTDEPE